MSVRLTKPTPAYFVRGWYADGATRTHHVTTSNVDAYARRLLTGFLPFVHVQFTQCPSPGACSH